MKRIFINIYSDGSMGSYWATRKSADNARKRASTSKGMPCAYRIVATEKQRGAFNNIGAPLVPPLWESWVIGPHPQ